MAKHKKATNHSPAANQDKWITVTCYVTQKRNQPKRHTATQGHKANLLTQLTPITATPPTTMSPNAHVPLSTNAYWTAHAIVDSFTGASLEYTQLKLGPDAEKWINSAANKIGRYNHTCPSAPEQFTSSIHPTSPQISNQPTSMSVPTAAPRKQQSC
jgi:hypothetical protein